MTILTGARQKTMAHKIVLVKSAVKDLDDLPDKQHVRIVEHLRQLEENPHLFGAEKLKGRGEYKLRVGNYRIVYRIDDKNEEVIVYLIEDRKQVYKRLRRK
jgi:mRNA interferase RelE/StbE